MSNTTTTTPENSSTFDRPAALAYLMSVHVDETVASAQDLLADHGFCGCCGVDYTGLDRDVSESAVSA